MPWHYQYRALLSEINKITRTLDHPELIDLWKMTKKDVAAWSRAMSRESERPYVEAHAHAWSRWEDLYTDPDEWVEGEEVLVLTVLGIFDLTPDAMVPHLHNAMEIGFNRARGFTRAESLTMQDDFLESQGGWDTFYGADPTLPVHLSVIDGDEQPALVPPMTPTLHLVKRGEG